ncbi:MAG: hypothetical protein JNM17_33650 [Archangium sp.]|nr:hypothetical protein [Archangium sp.]
MPDSRGTSEAELPLLLRLRTSQGGALLILYAVLNFGASLAMWLETRGPVRPLTHHLFSLVPWSKDIVGVEFVIAQVIIGLLIIMGGVHLRQFGAPSTVRTGAILAMLPFTSMWLLGVPLGLNAIFALREPLVREHFHRMRHRGLRRDRD